MFGSKIYHLATLIPVVKKLQVKFAMQTLQTHSLTTPIPQERYHVLLIEKYYVMDDVAKMEAAIERALQKFPNSMLLKFFYGLVPIQ
jgi:hypothetical protein